MCVTECENLVPPPPENYVCEELSYYKQIQLINYPLATLMSHTEVYTEIRATGYNIQNY